jgi:protein-serine/threonine kinase
MPSLASIQTSHTLAWTDILLTSPLQSVSPTSPLIKLTDFGLSRFIDPANPYLTTRCGSEAYAAPELVVGGGGSGSESAGSGSGEWRGYDGRQTDAWACGVVFYAVVCRQLPFGEGPDEDFGGGGGENGTRRGAGGIGREWRGRNERGTQRIRRRGMQGRRAWLMQIARGEWTWPDDNEDEGMTDEERTRRILLRCDGARKVVGRLLVRNPEKRAGVQEILEDDWVRGEVGVQMNGKVNKVGNGEVQDGLHAHADEDARTVDTDAEGDMVHRAGP